MAALPGGSMSSVRHRRLSPSRGFALAAAWHRRAAGLTQASFCRQHEIAPWVLRYWLARAADSSSPGFVQIAAVPRSDALEVVVGSVVVRVSRGFDAELLRHVVAALGVDGRSSC